MAYTATSLTEADLYSSLLAMPEFLRDRKALDVVSAQHPVAFIDGTTYYLMVNGGTTGVAIIPSDDADGYDYLWADRSEITVSGLGAWAVNIHAFSVFKVGSTYYMFGTGFDAGGLGVGGWGATSSTLTGTYTAINSGNKLIDLGGAGTWDAEGMTKVFVMKDGATWKMWYSAHFAAATDNGAKAVHAIGYATASAAAGPWTKHSDNPIQVGMMEAHPMEISGGELFFIGKLNGKYVMVYESDHGSPGHNSLWGFNIAVSDDGLDFRKRINNPVMSAAEEGTIGSAYRVHPSLLYDSGDSTLKIIASDDDKIRLFYVEGNWTGGVPFSSYSVSTQEIAVATMVCDGVTKVYDVFGSKLVSDATSITNLARTNRNHLTPGKFIRHGTGRGSDPTPTEYGIEAGTWGMQDVNLKNGVFTRLYNQTNNAVGSMYISFSPLLGADFDFNITLVPRSGVGLGGGFAIRMRRSWGPDEYVELRFGTSIAAHVEVDVYESISGSAAQKATANWPAAKFHTRTQQVLNLSIVLRGAEIWCVNCDTGEYIYYGSLTITGAGNGRPYIIDYSTAAPETWGGFCNVRLLNDGTTKFDKGTAIYEYDSGVVTGVKLRALQYKIRDKFFELPVYEDTGGHRYTSSPFFRNQPSFTFKGKALSGDAWSTATYTNIYTAPAYRYWQMTVTWVNKFVKIPMAGDGDQWMWPLLEELEGFVLVTSDPTTDTAGGGLMRPVVMNGGMGG